MNLIIGFIMVLIALLVSMLLGILYSIWLVNRILQQQKKRDLKDEIKELSSVNVQKKRKKNA